MEEKTFRILFTSDIHGRLFASPGEAGLDVTSRHFHKDFNTLIFDGGDLLQGGTAGAFLARRSEKCPDGSRNTSNAEKADPIRQREPREVSRKHPAAVVLNEAGFDAVTLENHDFNYGITSLNRYLDSLSASCLCANIRDRAGRLPIQDSQIFVLENGLRIGVFGLCTDDLAGWEREETLKELSLEPPLPAARRVLGELSGHCDLTVCLYHGGYEEDLETGELLDDSGENIACCLCRECRPDILFTGHQHRREPGRTLYGTYTLQPGAFCICYAEVSGTVCGGRLQSISSRLESSPVWDPMPPLTGVRLELNHWEERLLCCLPEPIPIGDRIEMALHGSPLADFINQVQLAVTGAQVSATCLSNTAMGLPSKVQVKDVFRAYTSANTLCTVLCDGDTLRRALEWSAEFLEVKDNCYQIRRRFLEPKPRYFHFDFYAGIDYQIDFTRPRGQRITKLRREGRDIRPEDHFTLCITNYRRAGGDGYEMFRSCQLIKADPVPVVEHLIEFMEGYSS